MRSNKQVVSAIYSREVHVLTCGPLTAAVGGNTASVAYQIYRVIPSTTDKSQLHMFNIDRA